MSYQYLVKKGPLFAFLVTAVIIVVSMIPVIMGLNKFDMVPAAQQAYAPEGNIFMLSLYLTALLLVLAVMAALVLSVIQVFKHPKGAMGSILALGALLVVFVIFFFLSKDTAPAMIDLVQKFSN
jgi:hypothetical protein